MSRKRDVVLLNGISAGFKLVESQLWLLQRSNLDLVIVGRSLIVKD